MRYFNSFFLVNVRDNYFGAFGTKKFAYSSSYADAPPITTTTLPFIDISNSFLVKNMDIKILAL